MSASASSFGSRTSPELAEEDARLAIVPVGATEQHGPHLPLNTDTVLVTAIVEAVVARTSGTLVGPVVALGSSSHHLGFQGTVSVGVPTFVATVLDICRSLAGAGLTAVLVNGHGGNRAPLGVALSELSGEGIRAYSFTYWELLEDVVTEALGADAADACGHACALETSLMQHLDPDAVRESLIPPGATRPTWPDPHMFSTDAVQVVRPFEELSADGVIGRPSLATAELGRRLFEAAVERAAREVERIRQVSG